MINEIISYESVDNKNLISGYNSQVRSEKVEYDLRSGL